MILMKFAFTGWVGCWAALLYVNRSAGWGWVALSILVGWGCTYRKYTRRAEPWQIAPDCGTAAAPVPPNVWSAPPELLERCRRLEKHFLCYFTNFESGHSAIRLIDLTALIFAAIGAFFPPAAVIALVFCALNVVLFLPALLWVQWQWRQLARRAGRAQAEALKLCPRPPLDEAEFCRRFAGPPQAKIALELVRQLKLKIMMYPGDSFLIACGKSYAQGWRLIGRKLGSPPQAMDTWETVVNQLFLGTSEIVSLPPPPAIPLESPPWPPELLEIMTLFRQKNYQAIHEEKLREILRQRPAFTPERFAAYWPTAREAWSALAVLTNARIHLGRPENLLAYPGDPLSLLFFLNDDEFETIDFIRALEDKFGVKIPDAFAPHVGEKTLSELVRFLLADHETAAAPHFRR